jgi:hypothetical protein
LGAIKHENRDDQESEARAGHWLHGQLAAQLPSLRHRGNEVLRPEQGFLKNPRLPVNRGFFAYNPKPWKGTKHE